MIRNIVKNIARRYFYFKFCCQRTQTYYQFVLAVVNPFMLLTILLELKGNAPVGVMAAFFLGFMLFHWWFGHMDISRGVAKLEQGISNSVNRELLEILDAVRRISSGEAEIARLKKDLYDAQNMLMEADFAREGAQAQHHARVQELKAEIWEMKNPGKPWPTAPLK